MPARFYNLGSQNGNHFIFDSKDKSVEAVPDATLKATMAKGLVVEDGANLTFALRQQGNCYSIYVGSDIQTPITEGRFSTSSERCELRSHEIRICEVIHVNNCYFIRVACHVWGTYAFEFPLYMEHLHVITYKDALNKPFKMDYDSLLIMYTKEPIYIGASLEDKLAMRKQSKGNCPDDVFILESNFPKINITKDTLTLYGVNYKRIPVAINISKILNYD